MKLKKLYASVAGALMLGGATAALATDYYVIHPAPAQGVVVQERIVTTPAQPVLIQGTPVTMSYTVDDAYPFPSPETRVVQAGVFVPAVPAPSAIPADSRTMEFTAGSGRRAPSRNPNTD